MNDQNRFIFKESRFQEVLLPLDMLKKLFALSFFLILTCCLSTAQEVSNKLQFKSGFLSYSIEQNGVQIGRNRTKAILMDCAPAQKNFHNGNNVLAISTMFQLLGVVCLAGYGTDLYFNDVSRPSYLILGGVLIGTSIPLNIAGKRQVGTGIGYYNVKCLDQP